MQFTFLSLILLSLKSLAGRIEIAGESPFYGPTVLGITLGANFFTVMFTC